MFFGAQVVQNVEKKMGYIYEKSIVAQIDLTHQLTDQLRNSYTGICHTRLQKSCSHGIYILHIR